MENNLEEKLYEVLENLEKEEESGDTNVAEEVFVPQEDQENGDTHTPEQVEEETEPNTATATEEETAPEEQVEKSFTQSQVNELVGNTRKEARERVFKELLERYGVKDNNELDGVFGKGQAYDLLNQDYVTRGDELTAAKTENALLKSKIKEDRWEDAKAILKSKGLDITVENIMSETATHPEWLDNGLKQVGKEQLDALAKEDLYRKSQSDLNGMVSPNPVVINKLGTSGEVQKEPVDEKKMAMNLFGL